MRRIEASTRRSPGNKSRTRLVLSGVVLAAALACVAQDGGMASSSVVHPAAQAADSKAKHTSGDVEHKGAAADNAKQKQIADESAQLLTMALALKAEVDKTTKDTLSLNVIRKADEIEKLAKAVKEKMKQNSGS